MLECPQMGLRATGAEIKTRLVIIIGKCTVQYSVLQRSTTPVQITLLYPQVTLVLVKEREKGSGSNFLPVLTSTFSQGLHSRL
jgi:hypothetical protein